MILRRVTEHVKSQNWFAVGLDFVIVVVGILIAFQISNWSAARQDNLIYQQARVRVIEEANANLQLSRDVITRLSEQRELVLDIVRDLETCGADDGAEERFMRSMQPLRFIVSLELRQEAINQILRSDAFLDNITPEDRAMLSLYARRIDRIANNSRFSDDFQLTRKQVHDNPIFKRTLAGDFARGLLQLALTVSYEEACQDDALNQFLFDRLENAIYIVGQARGLEQASREVLISLGESPSDAPEPPDTP
jgi:hypothetical protein